MKQFLILISLFVSLSGFSTKTISYHVKEFSRFGHFMLDDDGHMALYQIPLVSTEEHLVDKFEIQRAAVKRIHSRKIPGKSMLKGLSHMIFVHDGNNIAIRPRSFFQVLQQGTPHTYAITENTLNFTESSSDPTLEKVKNFFSKHYMISGMSKTVRFAGEFFMYRNSVNGEVFLVFDNASGTYRPNSAALPALERVLQANLADDNVFVRVKAFDQEVNVVRLFAHEQDCFFKEGQ